MSKYCSSCGAENEDDAKFCGNCGKPFDVDDHHENKIKRNPMFFIIGGIVIALAIIVVFFVNFSGDEKTSSGNTLMCVTYDHTINESSIYASDLDVLWNSKVLGSDYYSRCIQSVTFLDSLDSIGNDAWDVSQNGDGSVMAWVEGANEMVYGQELYNLYIAGDGGVDANKDSSFLFIEFINLEKIHFNDCFYTINATDMSYMFYNCQSLENLDLSCFDTSNVTNMLCMFYNDYSLITLDVSSFNTSQVTSMEEMFAGCSSLEDLDISSFDMSNADTTDMFDGVNE